MQFIIVDNKSGSIKRFDANRCLLSLVFSGLVTILAAVGYFSYLHGAGDAAQIAEILAVWRQVLQEQDSKIAIASRDATSSLNASVLRISKLQAHMMRLDALGERLTSLAKLDKGEFNFSQPPALGGPSSIDTGVDITSSNYLQQLHRLAIDIENRQQQMSVLETLLTNRNIQQGSFLSGRPVLKGWISSRYGYRIDPINGKKSWHNGVDFASAEGADVVAVAAGIITHSGSKPGYGEMIEISHGGGFFTRYGHHKQGIVKLGDIVKKGQRIGLVGSSGRSTGPHVHFEVFRRGKSVDPAAYIHRASR